jgi:hypothetical protein
VSNQHERKEQAMDRQRWEYKVVYVAGWERTSTEGVETRPEQGERNSAYARRFLNGLGTDGWELSGIQHTMPGQSYYVFKRPLADGAEPDLSVVKREAAPREESAPQASGSESQVINL